MSKNDKTQAQRNIEDLVQRRAEHQTKVRFAFRDARSYKAQVKLLRGSTLTFDVIRDEESYKAFGGITMPILKFRTLSDLPIKNISIVSDREARIVFEGPEKKEEVLSILISFNEFLLALQNAVERSSDEIIRNGIRCALGRKYQEMKVKIPILYVCIDSMSELPDMEIIEGEISYKAVTRYMLGGGESEVQKRGEHILKLFEVPEDPKSAMKM